MTIAVRLARRAAGALLGRRRDLGDENPFTSGRRFTLDQIDAILKVYDEHGARPGTPWDVWHDAHLTLPSWFRHGLDPYGDEYAEQQRQLWQSIAGVDRPYDPDRDEKEHDWGNIDPVRFPGYYVRRDPQAIGTAADHHIATGMILQQSGLVAGDSALEYGAGFGQTALALARMGVEVDTVDISPTFCEFVSRQASFFQVPLTPYHGQFGFNPRPGRRYRLIWFYESFHHCLDFQNVLAALDAHLADGGRIILAGEPVEARPSRAVPYPWGMRLHSEVVAVVRRHHWFELGFTEDFLLDAFARAGFQGRRIECAHSPFGRLFLFERACGAQSGLGLRK